MYGEPEGRVRWLDHSNSPSIGWILLYKRLDKKTFNYKGLTCYLVRPVYVYGPYYCCGADGVEMLCNACSASLA